MIQPFLLSTYIVQNPQKASIHTREMVWLPSKDVMKFRKVAIDAGMTALLVMNAEEVGTPFRLISYQTVEERADAAPVE